jgi:transcriptional regulator with XRE-family HTH domain
MTSVFTDIRRRLKDPDYRRAFGAESIKMTVALALIDTRERAGLTQEELARLSNVSRAYIAKLESGKANPSVSKLGEMFGLLWAKPSITTKGLRDQSVPKNKKRQKAA